MRLLVACSASCSCSCLDLSTSAFLRANAHTLTCVLSPVCTCHMPKELSPNLLTHLAVLTSLLLLLHGDTMNPAFASRVSPNKRASNHTCNAYVFANTACCRCVAIAAGSKLFSNASSQQLELLLQSMKQSTVTRRRTDQQWRDGSKHDTWTITQPTAS